jgi:cysteine desulfurase
MARFYLDNNATTPIDPRVLKAMLGEWSAPPGNPSSIHYFGREAKARLFHARQKVASFFHVKPEEIIFTSGGTESVNLLLRGFFGTRPKGHLITTAIEHNAIYRTTQALEAAGLSVTYVPVDTWGAPRPEKIEEAIRPETSAIMLSLVNGETGVKIDVEKIAHLAEKRGICLIIDAVAFIGKEPILLPRGVSAIAVAGHKFHAPKGIGCVVVRSGFKLTPLFSGSGHEFQRRAGTENLPGIIGLAAAIQILAEQQTEITRELLGLQSHFETTLQRELSDILINGEGPRISNVSNVSFQGIDGERLFIHLDLAGVAASFGAACSSGALELSRPLLNMGLDHRVIKSSLRFSFSRMNTMEEIDRSLERIIEVVTTLRK